MKPELQIKRVEDCHEWLISISTEYTSMQSIAFYIDQIGTLANSFAFINTQVAVAKEILNKNKKSAYESFMLGTKSVGLEYAPSLVKEYIASKLSDDQYNFDICDRCRSTINLTIEALRSLLSALKEEQKISSYAQNVANASK